VPRPLAKSARPPDQPQFLLLLTSWLQLHRQQSAVDRHFHHKMPGQRGHTVIKTKGANCVLSSSNHAAPNARTFGLAGIVGWPVSHSRSPTLHNYWLQAHGLAGTYVPLPVAPGQLAPALAGLAALGFRGCNVTLPHKVEALSLVHAVDANASRVGAVNTIVVQPDGSLKGLNTDGFGYIQSLLDVQPDWRADSGPITVLGAGGAARAVVLSLLERGAREVRLLNRSRDKADALARDLAGPITVLDWSERERALEGVAMLVNTTSQGMHGNPALDLGLERLPALALVSDLIYAPLETPLLQAAKDRGNPTVNGLGMLINQARPAFEAWFGVMPEITPALRRLMSAGL
jgi:shikimate dehydrogenase